MPRKKAKSKMYFTQETERAIIKYNKSDSRSEKNDVYKAEIAYPFDKLAENLIHTFKFYYFDIPLSEVKNEVVSYLVMNMHKFKEGKGKAFSYFSIVAKNYLILHNNNNYKKMKIHKDVDVLDFNRNIKSEEKELESIEFYNEFVDQMVTFWENNLTNIFKRHKDILVADSVLELFRKRRNIENFNKKSLYIMIREMTGSNTQHITRVINIMKARYNDMLVEYNSVGRIDTRSTGSIF
ncbi:MAG: hypothetical protein H8E03_01160 [Pelagibacteraceae bacterium]|nr:hypothetical protein [Pelagibacteraceae bacterium]